MAATDVLPSSPMTPGQVAPWAGFDDYLDFPSPISTPRLAPATAIPVPTASAASSSSIVVGSQGALGAAVPNGSKAGPTTSATSATNSQDAPLGPPPAPGSSPETLFRYYLAAELRKMGNPADDATIDRYVAQHCDSFTRAMERSQATASAAQSAKEDHVNGVQAFRSSQVAQQPSSPPYLLSAAQNEQQNLHAEANTTSIDPHMVDLRSVQQSLGNIQVASPSSKLDTTASSSHLHGHASSPDVDTSAASASLSFRSKSIDEDDEMSEDDDEDDDMLKPLAFGGKQTKRSTSRAIEETPIEGSIMGPSNELRPDPETYRKLTSKEKRQLRNKISARNFRTRRKEHISHLEQKVADRDTIIEGLRQQLSNVTIQNKELQEEVRALKTKAISSTDVSRIIEALQKSASGSGTSTSTNIAAAADSTSMAPPSLLARSSSNSSLSDSVVRPPTPSMTVSSPRSLSPRPSASITKPNTRKDVPSTSGGATGARSFWGGVGGTSGNGFMSVHTVLVPSYFNSDLSSTHLASSLSEKLQEVSKLKNGTNSDVDTLINLTGKMNLTGKSSSDKRDNVSEGELNAALVSLIDGHDDVAPPSYSEATGKGRLTTETKEVSSPIDVGYKDVQSILLNALNHAFSSSRPSSSGEKLTTLSPSSAQLDPRRLQALLDGRARLALVNDEGQVWQEDADDVRSTSRATTDTLTSRVSA